MDLSALKNLAAGKLSVYEQLFLLQEEYNAHTNISRIRTKEEFYTKHIYDSLALLPLLKEFQVSSLIDVGTGGGYPGFPLAIAEKSLQVFLNESATKKNKYLERVKNVLKLQNATILPGRAEDLASLSVHRENFEAATARALADVVVLLEYLSPLVAVGGYIFLLKSGAVENEVERAANAEKILGLSLLELRKYSIAENCRSIVVYKKSASCPSRYPRKAGMALKRPLV